MPPARDVDDLVDPGVGRNGIRFAVRGVRVTLGPASPLLVIAVVATAFGALALLSPASLDAGGWRAVVLCAVVVAAGGVVHEMGHVLVARVNGNRLVAVGLTGRGGHVRYTPPPVRRPALRIAAGPLAQTAWGGLGLAVVGLSGQTGPLVTATGVGFIVSMVEAAANLVPLPGSDGRKLIGLVRR